MRTFILAVAFVFSTCSLWSQTEEKTWSFQQITDATGIDLFTIDTTKDSLSLNAGRFSYSLSAKDNVYASGDYIKQNDLLVRK